MRLRIKLRRLSRTRRDRRLWCAGDSSLRLAVAVHRGSCCGRWQAKTSLGRRVHVVQVDERVAPAGDPDRNLTHLNESLLEHAPLRREQLYAMPVEAPELASAAERYAVTLQKIAGSPALLDLVHLGLGADGHTASLVPGDPVLNVTDADVALTAVYQGRRRMTLTYPILNRCRRILWVVTGSDKVDALARLRDADASIPAGRIQRENAVILADRAAAGKLAGS